MFLTTSRHVKNSIPQKQASSNGTVKSHSIRRSKTELSSSTASTTANIGLRSFDYRLRRDDAWACISRSAEETQVSCSSGGGGGDEIASECRGSEDRIVDLPKDEEEAGADSRGIRKTTHVVVQYGSRSDEENDEEQSADGGDKGHSRRANK